MTPKQVKDSDPDLRTIYEIADSGEFPYLYDQLRNLLANRMYNELHKCVIKIKGKIYFKLPLFKEWYLQQSLKKLTKEEDSHKHHTHDPEDEDELYFPLP